MDKSKDSIKNYFLISCTLLNGKNKTQNSSGAMGKKLLYYL